MTGIYYNSTSIADCAICKLPTTTSTAYTHPGCWAGVYHGSCIHEWKRIQTDTNIRPAKCICRLVMDDCSLKHVTIPLKQRIIREWKLLKAPIFFGGVMGSIKLGVLFIAFHSAKTPGMILGSTLTGAITGLAIGNCIPKRSVTLKDRTKDMIAGMHAELLLTTGAYLSLGLAGRIGALAWVSFGYYISYQLPESRYNQIFNTTITEQGSFIAGGMIGWMISNNTSGMAAGAVVGLMTLQAVADIYFRRYINVERARE